MFDVNKEINKYIYTKPKYFSRKDVNDLTTFLTNLEEYIKTLELIKNNCKCDYLTNENKLLKMKLSTIKYNLENIEFDNRIHASIYNNKKGMKDIIVLLEDIKSYSNFFIKIIIYILLFILKYLYYLYNFYNKKQ
jgi:hypothetical protein